MMIPPFHSDSMFFAGVLLLDISVHVFRPNRRVGQVRHHGHWSHHGGHDPGLPAPDGPHRQENTSPLWAGWHVHILYLHHDFIFDKGKTKPICQMGNKLFMC